MLNLTSGCEESCSHNLGMELLLDNVNFSNVSSSSLQPMPLPTRRPIIKQEHWLEQEDEYLNMSS